MDGFIKRWALVAWTISVAAVSAVALGFSGTAVDFSHNGGDGGGRVVLELFTSQGCSSCPPADALLSKIGSSTSSVIPLAYHVDYWNHLGWADPFSSHEFSERQNAYSRAMDLGGEYTPQAVIEGVSQCVGSDSRSIKRAIDGARSAANIGRVDLRASLAPDEPRRFRIVLSAQWPSASTNTNHEVMVAIFENGLVTKIGGGENGGREITYDYTVRKLLRAFELNSSQDGSVEKQLDVDLDPSWSIDHLGVAAFIQDASSLRVFAAASRYPIERN